MTSKKYTASDRSVPVETLRASLPAHVRKLKQFLCYALGPVKPTGRRDKFPYYASGSARHGTQGSPEDLAALVTFDEAEEAMRRHGLSGIGVAILADSPLVALDFDDCMDKLPAVHALTHGYTEVSPSGNGIRCLCLDKYRYLGPGGKLAGELDGLKLEVFVGSGFVTLTGNAINAPKTWKTLPKQLAERLCQVARTAVNNPNEYLPTPPSVVAFMSKPDLEQARRLVARIPNDRQDWEGLYNPVMCALRNSFPDRPTEAYQIFDDWARQHPCYDGAYTRRQWKSWKPRENGKRHTYGTLVYLATQPPQPVPKPPEPPAESDDDPYRFAGYVDELLDLEFPRIEWVVDEFLPPGLVLLAGPPKSGKSRFNMQLGLCVSMGLPFLGQRVRQGHVMYLSLEDSVQMTQDRVRGTAKRLNVTRLNQQFYLGTTWEQGTAAVDRAREALQRQVAEGHVPRLLIIDVLQRIRDPGESKKPQYEVDYEQLKPWAELRRDFPSLAIVITHHTRKAEADDPFDAISGTQGIAGAVDTMVMLRRPGKHAIGGEVEDEVKDRLLMYIRSRYRKDGDLEAVLRSERDLMTLTDEKPWELVGSGRQNEILKLMLTDPAKTWTSTEIHARVGEGTKIGTTQKHMQRMVKKGRIIGDNGVGYRLTAETTKF